MLESLFRQTHMSVWSFLVFLKKWYVQIVTFLELSLSRDWTWLWFSVLECLILEVICFVMEKIVYSAEIMHCKVILVHGKHTSHFNKVGFTVVFFLSLFIRKSRLTFLVLSVLLRARERHGRWAFVSPLVRPV